MGVPGLHLEAVAIGFATLPATSTRGKTSEKNQKNNNLTKSLEFTEAQVFATKARIGISTIGLFLGFILVSVKLQDYLLS